AAVAVAGRRQCGGQVVGGGDAVTARIGQRGGDGGGERGHRRAAGPAAGPGVVEQGVDDGLGVRSQRAVGGHTLGGERVQRRLLAGDALLGGGLGADRQRQR